MNPLPRSMLCAISRSVQQAGGDMTDAENIIVTSQRLDADLDQCAARMGWREFERQSCDGHPELDNQ